MASHFVKTVSLKEWWLTKADKNSSGNTVAVAGIESAGRQAARVFFSAPIVDRPDLFTLKTADGIFVLLKGLINKEQTCDNGFTEEVFKHFLIGFPSNWEECAEQCFRQGSEVNVDADLNSVQSTVTKMGNATAKIKQQLWKNSDCNNRPEHYTDEALEAVTELQDDQNIDSVEERNLEDARSDAQNHSKDRDICMNMDSRDTDVGLIGEGVRYHLRNREVRYSEVEGVYRGKHIKNVARGKSSSMKTMIGDDSSTIPSVASLENSQTPAMTPLRGKSYKDKTQAQHPNFAAIRGVNGANHNAKNIPTIRSLSISGEASVVCNSIHKINEAQKSHGHGDTEPINKDTGKDKKLISDHSTGGKPCQSKKRKRNERTTVQREIIRTRSFLKKTVEISDAFAMSQIVGSENLVKSGGVAVGGNNIENQNCRDEGQNKQTPVRVRSVNNKTNINISPQDADKLRNLISHNGEKSHQSKKGRKQGSGLTRIPVDNKNCHDSARPTFRTCTSKAKSHSKAAVAERERKASQGSTPKLRSRRKLDYAQETCTPERENNDPTSQSSVLRTSRSGRKLLPTMEFWRNQLPIYDADHGISGIREGSTILKVETQKGRKSCT